MNIDSGNENKNSMPESQKVLLKNNLSKDCKNLPITALVLGLCSLIFCFYSPAFSLVASIIGIIIGIISLIKKSTHPIISIVGLITSLIAFLLSVLFLFLIIVASNFL